MRPPGPVHAALEGARHLAVVDLEATCGPGVQPHAVETIEIGAVMLDLAPGAVRVVAEHQTFVCPVRSPVLTPFCTHLTSITQDMVDGAPRFPEAYRAFRRWLLGFDSVVFGSWGKYDPRQLRRDCAFHGIEPGLPATVDLKRAFARAVGVSTKTAPGVTRALRLMGLEPEGTTHRAIHDARAVARLVPRILAG